MIIDEKDNRKKFSELKQGEVFRFMNILYMKTQTRRNLDESINAVDLETGELTSVSENAETTSLSAILTVERGNE